MDNPSAPEIERLKTALTLTREHNIKLTEENRRLRERLRLVGLPPPGALPPVLVKVHPDLMPPPPPPPPKNKVHRLANQLSQPTTPPEEREAMQGILKEQVKRVRQGRRTQRRDVVYDGSKPLRTQWPLEP